MILLDTDHITLLRYPENPKCTALRSRLGACPDPQIGTTIISVEEQWRGWLAVIGRWNDVHRQIPAYGELNRLMGYFEGWTVLPFEESAADRFRDLRQSGVRIATMDLKIAGIALVHDAVLLSANLRDFRRVPDLKVENWLD